MTRDKEPQSLPASSTQDEAPGADASADSALQAGEQEFEEEAPSDHHQVTHVYRHNIARNMKRLRKLQKLTQADLGYLTGISQAQVAVLEVAKVDASLRSLTRVAQGLGTDPMTLLSAPPSMEEPGAPSAEQSQSEPTNPETAAPELQHGSEAGPQPPAVPRASSSAESGPAARERSKAASRDRPQGAGTPPGPEAVLNSLGQGLNLSAAKHIAGAVHRRLEAMERRHGSVPMTRPMLNALLVAMLNASQSLDYESEAGSSDHR